MVKLNILTMIKLLEFGLAMMIIRQRKKSRAEACRLNYLAKLCKIKIFFWNLFLIFFKNIVHFKKNKLEFEFDF